MTMKKHFNYAEECLQIAHTPQERMNALGVKGAALALLKRLEEGQIELSDVRSQLIELNWRYELTILGPGIWCFGGFERRDRKGNSYYSECNCDRAS